MILREGCDLDLARCGRTQEQSLDGAVVGVDRAAVALRSQGEARNPLGHVEDDGAHGHEIGVRFTVPGEPVPQGSMYSPKGSHAVIHSKRKSKRPGVHLRTVKEYRACAREAAQWANRGGRLIDVAVQVGVVFYVTRPHSRRNRERYPYPDRKPDLDKLARALGDALEGTVVTQDSRICRWTVDKLYADDREPCSVVTVREM